jgi:hypothetical protein
MFKRTLIAFTLSCATCLPAALLYDELTLSPGLTYNKFIHANPDTVASKYRTISPKIGITLLKNFTPKWGLSFDADADYDIDLNSKNQVNNGAKTFKAHSITLDGKLTLLYTLSKTYDIKLGLGAGVGAFWLKTIISNDSQYNNYLHAYLPYGRLYKGYKINTLDSQCIVEFGRIDSYYFKGIGYHFENTFWLQNNPTMSHGIRFNYHYWDLNLGVIRNKPWNSKFQSGSVSYEIKFK